ncbi:MAG: glycerol-3-phosphate dehydrogenase/oxidase [Gaiellaceae bacterium]
MTEHPVIWRERALERLESRRYDLLVIGAGIVGAGIAAEAAARGLDVALVDRRDFAGATSGASSKLIHGGLRYLRMGDLRTVRQAHHERRALMQLVAPHLVRRLLFLVPVYRHGPYRLPTLQAGLVLYATLARASLNRPLSPARAAALVPALRLEGLRSCGVYADAETHDGRLCLANVRAAADAGATVLNYAEVVGLQTLAGRVAGADIVADGMAHVVRARAVVNASGPWIDSLRTLEDPRAGTSIRLSKGVHVLLRLDRPWSAALTVFHDRERVTFALPWQGMLLLGTTDSPHAGEPDELEASEADIDQVLREAAVGVEPGLLERQAIRSVFAGLRALPLGAGGTVSARREVVLKRGRLGMISIAGGKLTTYRQIALAALRALAPELGLRDLSDTPRPLPGAVEPAAASAELLRLHPRLEPSTSVQLTHLYGSLAADVLAPAEEEPGLLEPLHPDGPDLLAQARYAVREEWATSIEDVLMRRTSVGARALATMEVRDSVGRLIDRERRLEEQAAGR